jgi:type I restriction enzyme, R subunit
MSDRAYIVTTQRVANETGRIDMTVGPEYTQVEKPLIDQLAKMGWTHLEGAPPGTVKPTDPRKSARSDFGQVFLEERLRAQINVINRGPDGRPWLDERRINEAVSALTRIAAPSLLEANERATEMLLNGFTVEGLPGWNGGRDQPIKYIDWENPLRNDFVVISQFRVDIPGTQGRRCIVPDQVLFVNGIPLGLVECKKPGGSINEAIIQHHRYADRRGTVHTTPAEGNPKLFHTVQLLVATNGDRALLGSITSGPTHYAPWRDPYPLTREELAHRTKKREAAVNQQDILVGCVLHPVRLLDIVHNYVTFMQTDDGTTIKAVPRYQQYRAVCKAIERLQAGKTKREHGEEDRRGGVIWHTQGSGKSLTMSFLVRKMRTVPGLRKTKIVVVTDRTQLQGQLTKTMELAGETVDTAKKITQARRLLAQHGPGIVFVMIQKQLDGTKRTDDDILEGKAPPFPELNADESIVVLIDEAHRSHASKLHMNLLAALPNCARIGFTGTPILMGKKKRTTKIFGPYIDLYRLADAEQDEAVVPILYQGNTVKGAVRDGRDMDEVFEDMLAGHTPDEMEQIKTRYATKGDVMEAEELISAKAKSMLRHYVGTILPNGYRAQVAAHSRRATLRYRTALQKARDELVAQIENLPEAAKAADPESLDHRRRFLVAAAKHLDQIKALDFIPVISAGTTNDEKEYEPWTDPASQRTVIADFTNPAKPPAFLIVKSMLLTGFDAPVEQVLYLDRNMKEAELLQAIARVNRPASSGGAAKKCGYVIDYVGVTNHLARALNAYAAEDVEGALTKLETDQVANLRAQLARVRAVFTDHNVAPGTADDAIEDCVELLADGQLRDRFEAELNQFLATIDTVLPLPEAAPFLDAANLFAEIARRIRRRYRTDGDFDPSLYGAKVRELIDAHMTSLGVDQILPPISITDPDYQAKVTKLSGRARASEMEHAIRHHISVHVDEDPTRYRRLSERLEQILADHKGNWEQQAFALADFIEKIKREDFETNGGDSSALNRVESALYGLLAEESAVDGVLDDRQGQRLADFSRLVHEIAVARTSRKDFWRHPADEDDLAKEIAVALITGEICPPQDADALSAKLCEVIKANFRPRT